MTGTIDLLLARIAPPANEYEESYANLIEALDQALKPHQLVGYHCTRLTSEEIDNVRQLGLCGLSPELVNNRLKSSYKAELLSQEDFSYLAKNPTIHANLANQHGNRTGKIWFCPNRSTLRDAPAVYRLFRSWGGEAVYSGLEDDPQITPALASLGIPCIVKCAIPFSEARHFRASIAEYFVAEYISDAVEYGGPEAQFDLYTSIDVPSCRVLAIIEYRDPAFEALTRCSEWRDQFRINGV